MGDGWYLDNRRVQPLAFWVLVSSKQSHETESKLFGAIIQDLLFLADGNKRLPLPSPPFYDLIILKGGMILTNGCLQWSQWF